jgi:hypothetical protein
MKKLFLATAALAVVSMSAPAKAGPLPSQREQWLNTPNYSLECYEDPRFTGHRGVSMTIDVMPSEWQVRLTNPADGKVWLVPIVEAAIGYRSFAASDMYNHGAPMPFVQYLQLGAVAGQTRSISDDHGRITLVISGPGTMSMMSCS